MTAKTKVINLLRTFGNPDIDDSTNEIVFCFSNMVNELWTEEDSAQFLNQWNGDISRIDHDVVEFHDDFLEAC